jgi:hypothetical protein
MTSYTSVGTDNEVERPTGPTRTIKANHAKRKMSSRDNDDTVRRLVFTQEPGSSKVLAKDDKHATYKKKTRTS